MEEELKTLIHDMYTLRQRAKSSYSFSTLQELISTFQEYEISVSDVSFLYQAWRNKTSRLCRIYNPESFGRKSQWCL